MVNHVYFRCTNSVVISENEPFRQLSVNYFDSSSENKKCKTYFCRNLNREKLNVQNMTKAEIVAGIAEETGLEKSEALRAVEAFMQSIKRSLSGGRNVYLRGFGSFIVKERAQKTGRNISKNTTIIIPAHNIPSFKPSKVFVDEVKNNVTVG
tara:strand:- start:293 stop:748 length:456 start_codon:yes stop_codon:yes gene_type:complete